MNEQTEKALESAHYALTRFWATKTARNYYKPQYVRDAVERLELVLKKTRRIEK